MTDNLKELLPFPFCDSKKRVKIIPEDSISVTIDREKLAELLFGQEFYEGLSKVVRHQYLRKADKLISCQSQWMKKG